MEEGMPHDEAERTARRDFGNVTLLRERSREVWQWQRLESLLVDLKHVCRRLGRSPGFAITVVLAEQFTRRACRRRPANTPSGTARRFWRAKYCRETGVRFSPW